MADAADPQGGSGERWPVVGWLLAPGFLALAVWMWAGGSGAPIPLEPRVEAVGLTPGPRRAPRADPGSIEVTAGVTQSCNGCHQIFKSESARQRGDRPLSMHGEIVLRHGMNDQCFYCHDEDNREHLALRDGTTIPFGQTPQLCAQCHGTVYRDWERGTHGKSMGAWDPHSPHRVKLSCNECHDPHAPAYSKYHPMPGPNTLRMGDQHPEFEAHEDRSPLRRAGARGKIGAKDAHTTEGAGQ